MNPSVRKVIHDILVQAQEKRDERPGFVPVVQVFDLAKTEQIPAWNAYELECVLEAVNVFRTGNGLAPITFHHIRQVEQQAVGHCDYTTKLALYAAELTTDQLAWRG